MLSQSSLDKLRASLALSDSINATFSLRHADYAVNWRFDVIVAITTLRAVGHVLHKIDCRRYPLIFKEVETRFKRWKLGDGADAVFPHFIEDARNTLLKMYEFPAKDNTIFHDEEFGDFSQGRPDPDLIVRGPFSGCDIVELLNACHDWWRQELLEIAAFTPDES